MKEKSRSSIRAALGVRPWEETSMAEHTIPLGGVTIGCEVRGEGLPVVLLHGFPLDRAMWDAQIIALAQDFTVISPDLRGFGRSTLEPRDAETGVDMQRYAEDVLGTLDALGVKEPVVLAGFSMGGYVAWPIALQHLDRLRGLALCDTRAAGDTEEAAAGRRKMAEAVLAAGNAEPALGMLDKLLSAEAHELRPDVVASVKEMMLRQSPEAIAAAQRGMARRPDVRSELAKITCPALCLVGQADAISKPNEMAEIAAALPNAKFVEVAGGHMAPMENPEAVTEALREFARSTE
jgi:pimeloyl-ACP methyl ester carboxylesterase